MAKESPRPENGQYYLSELQNLEPEKQEKANTLVDDYKRHHSKRRRLSAMLSSLILSAASIGGVVYLFESVPSGSVNVKTDDKFTNTLRPEAQNLGELAIAGADGVETKKDPNVKDGIVIKRVVGDGGQVFTIKAYMLEKGIRLEPSTTYDAYLQVDSCHENKKCSSPEQEQIEIWQGNIVQTSYITEKHKVVGRFWDSSYEKYPFNSHKASHSINSYLKNLTASLQSPEVSLALNHAKFVAEQAEKYIGTVALAEKAHATSVG